MGPNPELFRKMAEPFPSAEAADAAFQAFAEELGALREKHKVTNVQFVMHASYRTPEGGELQLMNMGHYGDSLTAEPMAAYAFGYEQGRREQMVAQFQAAGKGRRPRKEPGT
jgi:hypothetical protein